jgi:hypothetical protein
MTRIAEPVPHEFFMSVNECGDGEGAVVRLAGLLRDASLDVVKPTVVATAKAAVFDMTELQRSSAV